jgi:hypothetical protein
MMLASETDNRIPYDAKFVQRAACLNNDPDFTQLIETGFLELVDASSALAACKQDASDLHTNATSETETDTEQSKSESKSESREKQNPKASTSLRFLHNQIPASSEAKSKPYLEGKTEQLKPKRRTVLKSYEAEQVAEIARAAGLPAPRAADYAIAAQFKEKCGFENRELLKQAWDARSADSGDGTFRTVGELYSAAIGYGNYLEQR